MEYIYVRVTRVEYVTPEWTEGRAHSVLHVNWIAYPAESDEAQRWLAWVASMPATLQAAYVRDFERWQETQRFGVVEGLERV